nr:hypothetical protein [Streptomyces sp. SPB074]
MRPLFLGFPADPRAWEAEDSFLCGPDLLVAPVTRLGAREREVYLPGGSAWTDAASGETYPGGTTVTARAPLERVPVFVRAGADAALEAVRGACPVPPEPPSGVRRAGPHRRSTTCPPLPHGRGTTF